MWQKKTQFLYIKCLALPVAYEKYSFERKKLLKKTLNFEQNI